MTADPELVRRADRIVLPGVGAFADCRAGLDAVPGMVEVLEERVIGGGMPFLGICVGMQLMATEGREKAITRGPRLDPRRRRADRARRGGLKVPHMGWNTLSASSRPHPLLAGIPDGEDGLHAYFVHSYHLATDGDRDTLLATTDYGRPVTAVVGRDNMFGTQFHPEKSQTPRPDPDRQFPAVDAVILFPAIDLKDGQCVRLKLGDMEQATVFNDDPAAQAKSFEDQGFEYLHVVDLNGAFAGESVNGAAVEAILKAVTFPVQLGGGIRTLAHIEGWLDKGPGPRHPRHRRRARSGAGQEAARKFPGQVAVGIDARGGKVAVEGWAETSELSVIELAQALRGRRRRRHHLHRHRPRRRARRHQLGRDARAGARHHHPGDRLGRPRLDGRHPHA